MLTKVSLRGGGGQNAPMKMFCSPWRFQSPKIFMKNQGHKIFMKNRGHIETILLENATALGKRTRVLHYWSFVHPTFAGRTSCFVFNSLSIAVAAILPFKLGKKISRFLGDFSDL